jgi:RNA polymerase sigma-70 factor (ECF subfamily)
MNKLSAIKRGDQKAFAEVFETSYQKMFGFFMVRTKKDRELSKELTQLTYIKLWQSKHTLSEDHSLEKQLFIIAKYTLIDFIRKEATVQKTKESVTKNNESQSKLTDFNTSPFESTDYVSAILKELPPVRKKILQLKILQGYTNAEIAGLLSISVKTVEDHVTKGLLKLRSKDIVFVAFTFFFILH